MIETAITNIVDRIIQLLKQRELRKRTEFDDFVKPIYEQFVLLHADYLDSFKKYRKMLKEEQEFSSSEQPIFDAINEDHVFSVGLREKLYTLVELHNNTASENNGNILKSRKLEPLEEMTGGIQRYIVGSAEDVYYEFLWFRYNTSRSSLFASLKFLFSTSPKRVEIFNPISGEVYHDFISPTINSDIEHLDIFIEEDTNDLFAAKPLQLSIRSKAQWDNLQSQLPKGKGDFDNNVKKALGLSIIDELVIKNQIRFMDVSMNFEKVKAESLK